VTSQVMGLLRSGRAPWGAATDQWQFDWRGHCWKD